MSRVALAGARVLARTPSCIARIPRGGCASSRCASPRRPHAARRPIMPRRGFVGGRASSSSSSSPASPWPLLDAMEDARDSSMATPSPGGGGAAMHWTVSEPMSEHTDATSAVADVAHVSLSMATELLDIGAVYVKYWPEGEGEGKPSRWRRVGDRKYIAKGEVIRVHKHPRRYRDACWLGSDTWRRRVVHESDSLLVVDKPHRLPSMAHESNAVEHCGGCAERGLGLPAATLKVTHRLDSSTSGVLVLGKTESAVREFNDSVAKKPGSKEIVKGYVALVSSDTSVPLGSLTHWMYPGPFGPGAFHGHTLRRSRARLLRSGDGRDELKGGSVRRWKRCELRVLACQRATQSQVDTWRELFEAELRRARKPFPGHGETDEHVWVVRVELVTGRTHQVRAQLAAMGAPLLGDSLYRPMSRYLHDRDDARSAEEAWGRIEEGTVPDWPVALHAETLRWGDCVFSAPPPWDHT